MSASNAEFFVLKAKVEDIEEIVDELEGGGAESSFTPGGDLSGDSEEQYVVGIQGVPVQSAEVETNSSFVFDGTQWVPTNYYATPEAFGAIGDGVADDTTAVQNAVSDGRPVLLNKRYKLTSQVVVNTSDLVIQGNGTLLTTGDHALLKVTAKCKISGISFLGSGKGASEDIDAAHINQHGIFIDGAAGTVIHQIYAKDLAGSAVRVINTNGVTIGVLISNPRVESCNNAFHVLTNGEYVTVDNAIVSGCNRGAYIAAGNFSWTGGSATYNRSAVWVTAGANDGHGLVANVLLNHQIAYNLRFEGTISNGFRIVNCYMYGGAIGVLAACAGIRLEGCLLSSCQYYLNTIGAASRFVLENCIFDVASTVSQAPPLPYNFILINCKNIATHLLTTNSCIGESANEFILSVAASNTTTTFATYSPEINTSSEYTIEATITDLSTSEGQARRISNIKSIWGWNRDAAGAPYLQANSAYPTLTGVKRAYDVTMEASGNNVIFRYIGDASIASKWYVKITTRKIA